VDYIKIDGQFIRDITHEPVSAAMVRSINEIGQMMGVKTVAEFVENEATLAMLQSIGVDFAQGYLLGQPQPIEELLCHG
jgi:EAL domain-containing protein (putative c-di-GMP-specific phosphodiesterase class I)